MIKAVLIGDPARISGNVRSLFDEIKTGTGRRMAQIVFGLSNKIKFEKLSGQVLRNKTGTLRRSITPAVRDSGGIVEGQVATNIEYAAIHEYGGRTKPHDIFPKKGRALAFMMGGKQVIVKSVHHPGSVFPERSFMRSALAEMEPQIRAIFEKAVTEVVSSMRGAA
jgi:phage gpG-like protein